MAAPQERYDELFEGLPNHRCTGESGKVYYPVFCDVIEKTSPKVILEIGFNRGSSALGFLLASDDVILYSADIREDVGRSVEYLQELFPGRFFYLQGDSKDLLEHLPVESVDLVFVDGDHSYGGMKKDCETALELKSPYILHDEYHNKGHTNDVVRILTELKLEILEDYREKYDGNMNIFCVLTDGYTVT